MRATFLIAGKDLRQRLRDRSAILMALVVPLALAFVFNAIMGGVDAEGTTFRYALVLEDRGEVGKAFVSKVLGPIEDQGLIELSTARSEEEARRAGSRRR